MLVKRRDLTEEQSQGALQACLQGANPEALAAFLALLAAKVGPCPAAGGASAAKAAVCTREHACRLRAALAAPAARIRAAARPPAWASRAPGVLCTGRERRRDHRPCPRDASCERCRSSRRRPAGHRRHRRGLHRLRQHLHRCLSGSRCGRGPRGQARQQVCVQPVRQRRRAGGGHHCWEPACVLLLWSACPATGVAAALFTLLTHPALWGGMSASQLGPAPRSGAGAGAGRGHRPGRAGRRALHTAVQHGLHVCAQVRPTFRLPGPLAAQIMLAGLLALAARPCQVLQLRMHMQ